MTTETLLFIVRVINIKGVVNKNRFMAIRQLDRIDPIEKHYNELLQCVKFLDQRTLKRPDTSLLTLDFNLIHIEFPIKITLMFFTLHFSLKKQNRGLFNTLPSAPFENYNIYFQVNFIGIDLILFFMQLDTLNCLHVLFLTDQINSVFSAELPLPPRSSTFSMKTSSHQSSGEAAVTFRLSRFGGISRKLN